MQIAPTASEDDARYLALKARDARFDGHFFTGVTSTGIYCRPVCRVRAPKRENCQFFVLAAQAESAGFRPCLRCRPELAPAGTTGAQLAPWSVQDASAILARQAAQLLDTPEVWCDGLDSMAQLAQRLGVSARHVRRLFQNYWGISPLQYLQTRRLLSAKQLLTDTRLPIAQVAALSGFSSVRRFNGAFASHYRLQPRTLRTGQSKANAAADHGSIVVKAAYRPPYDVAAMLEFFAKRSVQGMESVDATRLRLERTMALTHAGTRAAGWVQVQFMPDGSSVVLRVSESLAPVLPHVLLRLRALLDLDADPQSIDAVLARRFPGTAGLRVPGTLDGFELGVRAILGQQITVQAARTLTQRLVARFGVAVTTPFEGLTRCFPEARILAAVPAQALGELGIVRQRQQAILALAGAVSSGQLALHPGADVPATTAALLALPGIGAWTASYIAMRALRWPDAFPCGDVALQSALGVRTAKNPAQAAELASQDWRPWRSYAVIRAWHSLRPESGESP